MATSQKPFQLVVFGASGFTGQFVAEEVAREQADPQRTSPLAWAVAGRSRENLQRVLERAAQKLGGSRAAGLQRPPMEPACCLPNCWPGEPGDVPRECSGLRGPARPPPRPKATSHLQDAWPQVSP